MAKLLCHLLMKVNHVIVANFYVANMSFNVIRENKILTKIPNLQYLYLTVNPVVQFPYQHGSIILHGQKPADLDQKLYII